jgi:hypothetical protein
LRLHRIKSLHRPDGVIDAEDALCVIRGYIDAVGFRDIGGGNELGGQLCFLEGIVD